LRSFDESFFARVAKRREIEAMTVGLRFTAAGAYVESVSVN
jgi:hypothetical protein